MSLGKRIRLNRLFAHPSGRLCSLAVDHFIGYRQGLPAGLTDVPSVLARLVPEGPDAITMWKGMALHAWEPYAGRVPLIVSSALFTPDDAVIERVATPEEVVRLGADAISVAIGVRGPSEGKYLRLLSDTVEEASRFELPVMAHIYPRDFSALPRIVHHPEDIQWAVRCGNECGADVIKVPYTGDIASYGEIVTTSAVPVVAAGGPRSATLEEALDLMRQVVAAGARGATIGRNIWGAPDPPAALRAFKAVIHGTPPREGGGGRP